MSMKMLADQTIITLIPIKGYKIIQNIVENITCGKGNIEIEKRNRL